LSMDTLIEMENHLYMFTRRRRFVYTKKVRERGHGTISIGYTPVNIIVLCGACIIYRAIKTKQQFDDDATREATKTQCIHCECLGAQHIWYLIHWYSRGQFWTIKSNFEMNSLLLFYDTPHEGCKKLGNAYHQKYAHHCLFPAQDDDYGF